MTTGKRAPLAAPARRRAVDSHKHIALYVQLAGIFRHRIVTQSWPAGFKLPNFETLAAQFDVARITVRQAVALLVEEGLLTTSRGRGTHVQPIVATEPGPLSESMNALSPEDEGLEIRVLEVTKARGLPTEYAGGHRAFERYVEISKLHLHRGEPFGMMRIFVAEEAWRQFPAGSIRKRKILRMLISGEPRFASELEQTTTVEPADFVLAGHLDYPFGSPVARIMRRLSSEDGRLTYAGASWYRGDLFVMRTTLPRSLFVEVSPSLLAPTPRRPARRVRDAIGPSKDL